MIKKLFFTAAFSIAACAYGQYDTIFKEGFDTQADIDKWTNIDRDGDGEKWEFYNAEDEDMPAFSGNFATSWSWFIEAFTPDNILISPKITLPPTLDAYNLTFKVGAFDEELFQEHYAVYVIPADASFTGTETPIFEETLDAGYTQTAKNISLMITEYQGQDIKLVFRHYNCTDIAFIGIDDIEIKGVPGLATSEANKTAVKIYPNPSSDLIKVEGISHIEKIRVFDMSGNLVLETKTSEANIQNLMPGNYIVNIYSGKDVISRKIIKK